MTFVSGMHVGKYELGSKLGEGGFGLVFAARDMALDRDVALKFLNPEHTANKEVLQRFLREARAAAKIAHPGVVTIYECGLVDGTGTSVDGTAFIAMERLQGESLTARLARSGRMSPEAAMEIARQVASALDSAHKAGIVHRDLKPDNIFLVADPVAPTGERVKVLDFGIAKLAEQTPSGTATHSVMVFGTPKYMAPEQCKSAAKADHRSDIYALGCILYELVCGAPPYDGEPGELIAMHQLAPTPRASATVPLPESLDALIDAMLAKKPDERFQTMAAVQRALEAAGAFSPGLAATLPPGSSSSMARFTPPPGALGVLPDRASGSYEAMRRSSAMAAAVVPSPTTMSSASGQTSSPHAGTSKLAIIAGAATGAAIVGIGVWLAFGRSGGEQPQPQPQPSASAAASPAPPAEKHNKIISPELMGDITSKMVAKTPEAAGAAAEQKPPTPTPTPTLTIDQVQSQIQSTYSGSIRRCFAAALKKNAATKPTITIAFRVEPDGTTSHVELAADADFAACVRGKIADWKFPATAAPLDVHLPAMTIPVPKAEAPTPKPETKILKPDKKPDTKKPCDPKNGVCNPFDNP